MNMELDRLLNELDRVQSCHDAVADLLLPNDDLSVVKRDSLYTLVDFINDRQKQLTTKLRDIQIAPRNEAMA